MSIPVRKNNHPIDETTRQLISSRYKRITKAVNLEFWNTASEIDNSIYVGSYGRGTAIGASDLDVLIELPSDEYNHFTSLSGNGQSRLLQAVKNAIKDTYATTDVRADGQVVVIRFSDGMKFEILPAFPNSIYSSDITYKYPDTHMGGNWLTTNPRAEQQAIYEKDKKYNCNGLLKDTCKHIRYVKSEYFSSYNLSGILIDSFVYIAIGDWHWLRDNEEKGCNGISYESVLLDNYNKYGLGRIYKPTLNAPGSNMRVLGDDWEVLGKVLNKMV